MTLRRLFVLALLCVVPVASPGAQQMDMAAITRWSSAKVVRYHIVGVYQAQTDVTFQDRSSKADVTDRVVLDLDWDVQSAKLVGPARVQNTKSEVKNLRNAERECPPPAPGADYEHLEVTEAIGGNGTVELKGTRSFPQTAITDCSGMRTQRTIEARQQPVTEHLAVPEPMILAMPSGAGGGMFTISADKKSFAMKVGDWTWTYTPSVVK